MIEGNTYYFILEPNCYKGIYLYPDRFIENNFILSTDTGEWSLPINKIFEDKDACLEYMAVTYEGYNTDLNFINC